MMNVLDITDRIKQRPPFLMIERVTVLKSGEYACGIKNVSVNEPYFTGHFPDAPIMPGVLIIECCAQLCSLVDEDKKNNGDALNVLLKADGFKFLKPVIPGDTLKITVRKTRAAGALTVFDTSVCVGDTLCAKGTLTFTAIPKDSVYPTAKTEEKV